VTWAKSKKVRLAKETVCGLPSPMQGKMLRKLEAEQLHCGMYIVSFIAPFHIFEKKYSPYTSHCHL
jgi:hypothetical protein